MTGRVLFAKSKRVINAIVGIFRLLPTPILCWMLSLCRNIKNSVGIGIRYVLLKSLAKDIGDNVSIRENVIILSPKSLSIGKNVSVHPNCYIDAAGGITIGDNVSIATSSILISTSHTWDNEEIPIKYNPMKSTPIKIDNDVWIGCNVKIIGPCHIGERSICAAGAVVKGEIVRHCIVGGVPAKTIKTI